MKNAKYDKALNSYVIAGCLDKISDKLVGFVINSLDLSDLKYVGIITSESDGGLQLTMYHFRKEIEPY